MGRSITTPPTFRQLTYLLALHEHQHFGRAAAACFVSQSTLSAGLAELERLLDSTLVERSKRSVRFTNVGEEVAAGARGVVRAMEDLVTVAQGAREPLVGPVRMAAIPTIAPFLLPRIVQVVEATWPRLRLFVREMLTGPACEALQRGAIDCVLLALPADCGAVETFEIMIDRLLLAARPTAGAWTPLDAIDGEDLLLLDEGHCLRDHVLTACNLTGDRPGPARESRLVASTLHTLVQMVDAGLGVTFLPQMAVTAGILVGTGVDSHALDLADGERRIVLAWRKGNPRAGDLRLLGGAIREAVGRPDDGQMPAPMSANTRSSGEVSALDRRAVKASI